MQEKSKKGFKITALTLFYIIVLFAAIIDLTWVYFKFNKKLPNTVTTTYVNTVTDQHGAQMPFMELNYCANANDSGEAMTELCFNYYTDVKKSAVKTWGLQQIGDSIYYYDRFDGTSWVAVKNIEWGTPMIIDIDGEVFSVALTGQYQQRHEEMNFASVLGGIGKSIAAFFVGDVSKVNNDTFKNIYYTPEKYTFADIANIFTKTVAKTSKGYGDYTLPLVNLIDYFTIQRYDAKKQQFVALDYTTFNFDYFSIKCSTGASGVLYAKQSLFKMVKEDANYNKSGITSGDYWQNAVVRTLSAVDFDLVYSPADDGYLLSFDPARVVELNAFEQLITNIEINLGSPLFEGKKIVGLEDYAFFGLKVNTLSISNGAYLPFKINSKSLWDTDIKNFAFDAVVLDVAEDAYNGGAVL